MSYLLDTNTCIAYLNPRPSKVVARLQAVSPSQISLCSVVKAELYDGAYRSPRRQQNLALLAAFFGQFSSLPFDDAAADVAGRLRAHLYSIGTPIGPNDLMIAAIALANSIILVTHNTCEFGRVPGLAIEDWETT